MADTVVYQSSAIASPPDATIVATDDAGASGQVQIVKLALSANGSAVPITADADGLLVNMGQNEVAVNSLPAITGTVTANAGTGPFPVSDNGGSLTVDGTVAATQSGTWTVQPGNTANTTAWKVDGSAVTQPVSGTVTANAGSGTLAVSLATVPSHAVTNAGTFAVQAAGDVAHDGVDSGNPVKVGGKARSALPTAVANSDRTDMATDLWGRPTVTHIDPAQQVTKTVNVTTTQAGTDVWTPASGKRIAVTDITIASYGTTAGRVILWFGANADTTYTAGTDQVLEIASFVPSASATPGLTKSYGLSPVFAVTADHEIHLTTDANISLDITVRGYEFG